jgi:hypothetical protein
MPWEETRAVLGEPSFAMCDRSSGMVVWHKSGYVIYVQIGEDSQLTDKSIKEIESTSDWIESWLPF